MSLPNYLSAIKSSGIYRFVWDKSEIEGVDAETLRLVVGYSEKGPFNTPMYIKSASEFKTAFGGISRKLEKRGVFFHRLALQALLTGPIIALNLKKFSNDPESPYDKVEAVTLNASGDTEMPEVIKLPVEGIYNKVRFWNLSPEAGREALGSGSYISIFETDDSSTSKSIIIRGYKPAGYDITIKQWYSNFSEEMPEYYEPIADTLLNQYFAEIYVFEGQFTEAMAKSKELNKYFDVDTTDSQNPVVKLKPYILNAFGERVDTLQALASDKNSNFVKMYRGTTLPEFKDNYNNYISLNLVFNSDTYLHKLMIDFNTDLFDDESIDIKDLLNTSGWYNDNLAGWTDTTYETGNGLQKMMDYLSGQKENNTDSIDDYYQLPTGIKLFGTDNIVPDADIIRLIEEEAFKIEGPSTEVTAQGITRGTTFACTSDGNYIVTGGKLFKKVNTDYVKQTISNLPENITMAAKDGNDLYLSDGINLYLIDTDTESLSVNTISAPTTGGTPISLFQMYLNSGTLTFVYKVKDSNEEEVLKSYTFTNPGVWGPGEAFNKTTYEESFINTDEGEIFTKCSKVHKLYVDSELIDANGYYYDSGIKALVIGTNKIIEYPVIATSKIRLSYSNKTTSSNPEKGGDVQFLDMKNCYNGTTTSAELLETTKRPDSDFYPYYIIDETLEVTTITTDAFSNFGLQAGDKFLGKNGQVSTLISIEDVTTDSDRDKTTVPVYCYTFNYPLQFQELEYSDFDEYRLIYDNDSQYGDMILIKLVNPFAASFSSSYEFTYLQGFEYSNPKPASTSQYDKLQWQWYILDTLKEYTGLRIGLTEKKDIDYRYIVDTFESFVESECKSRLSLLAKEKDNCLALLNFPFIETFRKCTYTSFTDDKGQLNINYIAQGGNPRKPMSFKFSLPTENNGASWCSFNTAVVLSDGTIKTTIPSAALVSNNFMEKYVSRQPYYIVAGPNYGKITDYQLVGPDFNFGRADLDALEPFGVNAMVYVPRIGTYINSNQTAKQNPVTALSKINIRELVIYLQDEIEKLLQSYQWEFNNQTLRDTIKTKADTICGLVKANGGIYDYLNVCDSSNNPPEVIDNEMIVLSTSIEGARGAGKMVQELTLYKTGGLQAMINNG